MNYPRKRPAPDTGPETPVQAVVKIGQVWQEVDPRGGRTATVTGVAAGDTQAVTLKTAGQYAQSFTANRHHFGSPNGWRLIKDVK